MPNPMKLAFLEELRTRFGAPRKLPNSESLYELGRDRVRLYFRYSRKHPGNRTFFGLRKVDLQALEGHRGVLCFFWDGQPQPLFVPLEHFEEVLTGLKPAADGQIKAQVYEQMGATELYFANAGRFNVESYLGWDYLESLVQPCPRGAPTLSHNQVQTLLGGIGASKGFDIWVPRSDRPELDWHLTSEFRPTASLPAVLSDVKAIAEEVDVIWIERGAGRPVALYEVEHSTPIYSGLLRFNDIHLVCPNVSIRFGIVSNEARQSLFVKQLNRPTFRASGLREICTFLEYNSVYGWHRRIRGEVSGNA